MHGDEISQKYPLHYAIWSRNFELLTQILELRQDIDIDLKDPRGRTPLMLAVTLDQEEMARELLQRGADADTQNKDMWSVSHEAIATGNSQLAKEVITHRDYQRSQRVAVDMKQHLEKLKDSPDFYAEMSWEFASWVPFVSKLCPSDTYKIWKKGSSLRIDTTLVGFEGHSWQRGNQSFIFRLQDETTPQLVLIDHEAGSATIQSLAPDEGLAYFEPTEDATYLRMTSPISTTYIDMDKIGFERSKGGILSWIGASEKREKVAGYDCKVFNASNVEVVSKTRSEHLSEADRARLKQEESSHPLSSILNMVRTETGGLEGTAEDVGEPDIEEYFADAPMKRDIGRQRNVVRKSNSFKATLWLAEQYPLNLQEQVAPIVNLMSSSSAHFSRLNTFMRMQLPAGFPVKIEIPLFHVVSAKITFGRINEPGPFVTPLPTGTATPSMGAADSVDGVPLLTADGANPEVEIDPKVFDIPADYRTLDDRNSSMLWWPDEDGDHAGTPGVSPRYTPHAARYSPQQQEDMLLQLAIEQSLLENAGPAAEAAAAAGASGIPIQAVPPRRAAVSFADEDQMLELAIRRSLEETQGGPSTSSSSSAPHSSVPEVTITPVPEGVAGYIAVDEYLRSHSSPRGSGVGPSSSAPPSYRSVHEEEMELALKMSLEAAEEDERRRRQRREGAVSPEEEDDDEVMRRILELSMTDK